MPDKDCYDTILIFQKPDLYFFPHYQEIVFSPFGVPEHSLRYWIYKISHFLRLPCCAAFWGGWKDHIRQAKRVIIFDYGYQAGMEQYIHKINPRCQVFLFYWNIITKQRINYKLFTDKSAIYSTDPDDCKTYHFHYNHMFYCRRLYTPYDPRYAGRLFFLGTDKGRGKKLLHLKRLLTQSGLDCDIRLLSSSKDRRYRALLSGMLTDRSMPYPQYCEALRHCGVLLDIVQEGQAALTMRVMESIYFSKKLITDNPAVAAYDFYHPDNIFLLPEDLHTLHTDDIRAFLQRPFVPYGEDILARYDFAHWAEGFHAT